MQHSFQSQCTWFPFHQSRTICLWLVYEEKKRICFKLVLSPNPMILMIRQLWQSGPPIYSHWLTQRRNCHHHSAVSSCTRLAHCRIFSAIHLTYSRRMIPGHNWKLNAKDSHWLTQQNAAQWLPSICPWVNLKAQVSFVSCWIRLAFNVASLKVKGKVPEKLSMPSTYSPTGNSSLCRYLDSTCHQLFQSSNCQGGTDICDVENNGPPASQRRSKISKYLVVTSNKFICRINSHAWHDGSLWRKPSNMVGRDDRWRRHRPHRSHRLLRLSIPSALSAADNAIVRDRPCILWLWQRFRHFNVGWQYHWRAPHNHRPKHSRTVAHHLTWLSNCVSQNKTRQNKTTRNTTKQSKQHKGATCAYSVHRCAPSVLPQ